MGLPSTKTIIAFAVGVVFAIFVLPMLQNWWASRS